MDVDVEEEGEEGAGASMTVVVTTAMVIDELVDVDAATVGTTTTVAVEFKAPIVSYVSIPFVVVLGFPYSQRPRKQNPVYSIHRPKRWDSQNFPAHNSTLLPSMSDLVRSSPRRPDPCR